MVCLKGLVCSAKPRTMAMNEGLKLIKEIYRNKLGRLKADAEAYVTLV